MALDIDRRRFARVLLNLLTKELFLFNGDFGRLNYREDLISLFKIHSLDRTGRDNRRYVSSRSSNHNFGYDFVGNDLFNRICQPVSDASAHAIIATVRCDIGSIVVVIMMSMVAVISPMPTVPIAWGSGIICIWIPGIGIIVNVRMPIISIRIIIVARRIGGVAARKSKTESLSSGNQDGGLSVSTLPGNEGQSAYRQSNQEKLLHKITSSIRFGHCLLFCEGRLRVFLLSRNSNEARFAAPSKHQMGMAS